MRFLDVFLMHCLLSDCPPDTPQEIAALGRNQHRTAASGREPGLTLDRFGVEVPLMSWGLELIDECVAIADAMDRALGGQRYANAVAQARRSLLQPDSLPSARVLAAMARDHDNSFVRFIRAQSLATRAELLALPFSAAQQAEYERLAAESVHAQKRVEASDSMPFEQYRQIYVSPSRLGSRLPQPVPA
jgi:glutamate--cysteine ligase